MAEGNGIDLGSIYGLLLEVAKTVSRHDAASLSLRDEMAQRRAELKSDAAGLRYGLKADIAALRNETHTDITALRQTVTQYHASVPGHGILVSELEERVRRIETQLDLPAHISG